MADADHEVLSTAQAAAWAAGRTPAPEQVSDDVWAIACPIPGGPLPYTLAYALGSPEGVHLVDPGWDAEGNLDILDAGLRAAGASLDDVRTVIATHFHPDHLGLAARIRARTGAEIVLSATDRVVLAQESAHAEGDRAALADALAAWGVPEDRRSELLGMGSRPPVAPEAEPDRLVGDGDLLALAGHSLLVVATPGHTGGHICLADDDRRLIYTGDHVLPGIYAGVGIGVLEGSDPLGDYFDSLDRLAPYDDYTALPGHEYRFRGLRSRREGIAAHHLRRTAEVAALIPSLGDAPIWDYARRLTWSAGWEGLHGFHLLSALRQTALHRDFVRSGRAASRLER